MLVIPEPPRIPHASEGAAQRYGDGQKALKVWTETAAWLDMFEAARDAQPCPATPDDGVDASKAARDFFIAVNNKTWAYAHELYLSGCRAGTDDRAAWTPVFARLGVLQRKLEAEAIAWKLLALSDDPRSRWSWADALYVIDDKVRQSWRYDVRRAVARLAARWTRRDETLTVTTGRYPHRNGNGEYSTVWWVIHGPCARCDDWFNNTEAWQFTLGPTEARRYRRLSAAGVSPKDAAQALKAFDCERI